MLKDSPAYRNAFAEIQFGNSTYLCSCNVFKNKSKLLFK